MRYVEVQQQKNSEKFFRRAAMEEEEKQTHFNISPTMGQVMSPADMHTRGSNTFAETNRPNSLGTDTDTIIMHKADIDLRN